LISQHNINKREKNKKIKKLKSLCVNNNTYKKTYGKTKNFLKIVKIEHQIAEKPFKTK